MDNDSPFTDLMVAGPGEALWRVRLVCYPAELGRVLPASAFRADGAIDLAALLPD